MTKHSMDDKTGFDATDEEMGLKPSGPTPGPWEYVPSTEHHGPYVCGPFGGDVCDCYTMSNPSSLSVRNGGDSTPIHFMGDQADANARLIAAAPDMLGALKVYIELFDTMASGTGVDQIALAYARDGMRAAIKKATGGTA